MPGDLSKWRLQGLSLDTEIATPYKDELESDPDNDATDAPGRDPILSAPPQQPPADCSTSISLPNRKSFARRSRPSAFT